MARFSEAKKLEAVEQVKGGTPAEDVAKKYGVKPETLEGWQKESPKVVQLKPRSLKVKGRVRLPRAKASTGLRELMAPEGHDVAQALALMYKSDLSVHAFREALALLEG